MDLPKRAALQGSPGSNPREMAAPRAREADENATPRRGPVPARSASPQRKKVLGVRNGGGGGGSLGAGFSAQPKVAPPSITEGGRAGAYDPKTNCTTPRPEFLRYDPKRSAEILLRLEREAAAEEECSSLTSGTEISEAAYSGSSARESDSEFDDDADDEEVLPAQGGGRSARRLLLLLVSAACLFCYIYCMSSPPFPARTPEEPLSFGGLNGSTSDIGVHQVFSLPGPVDMMGLEDEQPRADIGQIVNWDSEDGILLHGSGASPSNFMAVAMMGIADACPDVPFGEFSCQIGDEGRENMDVLMEDSEIGKVESEEKAEESSEVVCSGGDVTEDSLGSIHSYDIEEVKLGLVHQVKREDDSEHSMEKIMESESVIVENEDKGLGSAKLDNEFDSWEYENTTGAAKELVHMVKLFWSAVEPHLLKMLACLSVAGFVIAMLSYSQRSRKVNPQPVSQRISSASPARVPILAPHNVAQLPVFHSEQPVQQAMPKQELSSSLELPVQSLFPKPDPSICITSRDRKIQQGGPGLVRVSDVMDHKVNNTSKPPVVQLLGEFSYVDTGSSRGRSVKDTNRHGGDTMVQESVSLRKDIVTMQKESDKIQSPGAQAPIRKKNAAEEERMDATPTPLRRSTRLRKKVSP